MDPPNRQDLGGRQIPSTGASSQRTCRKHGTASRLSGGSVRRAGGFDAATGTQLAQPTAGDTTAQQGSFAAQQPIAAAASIPADGHSRAKTTNHLKHLGMPDIR